MEENQRIQHSPFVTATMLEENSLSKLERISANEGFVDKLNTNRTLCGHHHKLSTRLQMRQRVRTDKTEFTSNSSINPAKFHVNNNIYFREINIQPNAYCNTRLRRQDHDGAVFTFVKPSPCHKAVVNSNSLASISKTRQLANWRKSYSTFQKSVTLSKEDTPVRERTFEGARFLFCTRSSSGAFLTSQESLSRNDEKDSAPSANLNSEQRQSPLNEISEENLNLMASARELGIKWLERQQAFEDEDGDIQDVVFSASDIQRDNIDVDVSSPLEGEKTSKSQFYHLDSESIDNTNQTETSAQHSTALSSTDFLQTPQLNKLTQEFSSASEYGDEENLDSSKTELIKVNRGNTDIVTFKTPENQSDEFEICENLPNAGKSAILSYQLESQSHKERTLDNKQDSKEVQSLQEVNSTKPDEISENTAPRTPKKVNRVKLALATSHAGIFVTGDSQEDDYSSDSPLECSFEKCPSWVGTTDTRRSSYLTPHYQPSTSSNEEKSESTVIFQRRKSGPISLISTRQISNQSSEKDYPSSSPHSKTSGYSVQDSGFEASGRHSNALLSASFRKFSVPKSSHSGDGFSSDEYLPYAHDERPTGHSETKSKRTAVLLTPSFRSKSDESSDNAQRSYLSSQYSNSSEADSGVETPRSVASLSPHDQRRNSSISVNSRKHDRSSRFSTSKLSLKSSTKSQSSKGSFLSFLSPKSIFSRSRANSETCRSSCGSKSSRKRLSDFPDEEKLLILNVSGRKFKLHEYFTSVYPETLLGNSGRNKYYDTKRDEFFFDRDPEIFRHIWNFYYTGKLHFPTDECVNLFVDEIKFFGVSEDYFCNYCWEDEYSPALEKLAKMQERITRQEHEMKIKTVKIPDDASLKEKIWLTTKHPVISLQARVFYFFSILAIVISTVANITETIPCSASINICKEDNQHVYFYIDAGCVSFFTIEYLIRLITAPKRLAFIRKFMSIIDLLAIIPFYCDLLIRFLFGTSAGSGINFLEILRILRIIRIFKLLKNSRRLQALVHTFRSSTTELGLIVVIYMVLVTVFSSVMYYAEMQDNPKYTSIPESMWYAVITTTTTGYGDIVPETILGKLVGCACCLLGVLIVALPVPILQIR